MRKADLTLNEPLEVDIGDSSPYLTVSLTPGSSRTSSTDESLATPTPYRSDILSNSDASGIQPSLSRKKSFGTMRVTSESFPDLAKPARPLSLYRSFTLPRVFQLEERSKERISTLNGLDVTPDVREKIMRWILGVAIVNFDVDEGPVVDGVYPPCVLLPSESESIAFASFPDSAQFDQGSQVHSFRIREQLPSTPTGKRPLMRDGFIYGYSYFTQRRDVTSKRGYKQASVVILTQHQYPSFFSKLVSILGPLYQNHGTPMLEAACHNIATWRDPTPGQELELGFLGSVLQLSIPNSLNEQQMTHAVPLRDSGLQILALSPPLQPPPVILFESALSHLWSLWECLVLCEPILVFGSSPAQTSQAIWWLRSLLRPLPLACDIRPYFTMQDADHLSLVNKLPPKAGLLLGVTNPFFEKSCSHWPHVLSLGRRRLVSSGLKSPSSAAMAGPPPGWKTKTHKRYISKDRALLKQVENAFFADDRTKLEVSLALHRHFSSRTTELITPLARYLNTLIPSPTEVARARTSGHTLRLKTFNIANFLSSLKSHGSTLPFRSTSKRTEFYERWLKTPAFGLWLAEQEQIVHGVLEKNIGRI